MLAENFDYRTLQILVNKLLREKRVSIQEIKECVPHLPTSIHSDSASKFWNIYGEHP